MTENKRFTEIISTQKVIDNQTGKEYDCLIDDELLKLLNELAEENKTLKTRFKEERETAMRLGSECDNLTIKNQKLELEIIRLEMIIKTGEKVIGND